MAPSKKPIITPLPVAIKEAMAMIKKDALPTHKQLAAQWHCSTQRVQYVLRKIKAGNPPPKRRGRPPAGSSVLSYVAAQSKHPVLVKLTTAVNSANLRLAEVEQHISRIPGLASVDRKAIIQKAQQGIWQGLHGELTGYVDALSVLAAGRKRGK